MTHASKYPAPVLSLGISPDCQLLAVGMADGTLSVRRHERPSAAAADQAKAQARRHYQPRLTAANYRCAVNPHVAMHAALLATRFVTHLCSPKTRCTTQLHGTMLTCCQHPALC